MTPTDRYKNLSHDSHGDPEAVRNLIDTTARVIKLEPRRTVATRASLLVHAGFSRDQAAVIAEAAGLELEGLDRLNAAIRTIWDGLGKELPPG